MENNLETLVPDEFYHIYNRANGNENIFVSDKNHLYFFEKFWQYILPICLVYSYCLMPNHFHFLIRIKSEKELSAFFNLSADSPDLTGFGNLSGLSSGNLSGLGNLISKQFSNFFNAYAKAFNKQQNRRGSLFIRPFKRKKITNNQYLKDLILYIHNNPIKASLCKNVIDWKYSSYSYLLNNSTPMLQRDEVISWFDDKENFIDMHLNNFNDNNFDF